MFLEDEIFKPFINDNRISRSSAYRKYINRQKYRIDGKPETAKCFSEIQNLVKNVLDIEIKEAL
jgi:hypothetical protein